MTVDSFKQSKVYTFIVLAILIFTCADLFGSTQSSEERWQGRIRPGFAAGDGDNETDYFLDLFIPVYGNKEGLLFFNTNLRVDDNDGNEQNIGFGYRRLFLSDRLVIGINGYFDAMRSEENNRYKQAGAGIEALSHWLDFRANYYHPVGNDKNRVSRLDTYKFASTSLVVHRGQEEAMEGFDGELGVLLPLLSDYVETRAYVGAHWYNSTIEENVDGWSTRIEIRPAKMLSLNLEYKDNDIRDATFIGGYLDIPFSFGDLLSGRNPFSLIKDTLSFGKGTRKIKERMLEKVMRDRHITTHAASEGQETKIMDMIYVNADNTNAGSGTLEDPYQDMSSVPADSLYKNGTCVYVFSWDNTADTFNNVNFTLLPQMVLWGQRYRDPVMSLGGGPRPIMDGGGSGSVITLANSNEVRGLTVQNGVAGISGANVRSTYIHHNIIQNNVGSGRGISIVNNFAGTNITDLNISYTFDNNQIMNNAGDGIYLDTDIRGDDSISNSGITYRFSANTITGNSGFGMRLRSDTTNNNASSSIESFNISNSLTGNIITGNTLDGIDSMNDLFIWEDNSSINNVVITNSIVNNNISNNEEGVDLYNTIYTDGNDSDIDGISSTSTLAGNTINGNSDDGVQIMNDISTFNDNSDVSNVVFTNSVTNNTINNNVIGIQVENDIWPTNIGSTISNVSVASLFAGNTVNGNSDDGIRSYEIINTDDDNSTMTNVTSSHSFTDNTISSNNQGIDVYAYFYTLSESNISNSSISTFFSGNTIAGNADDGIKFIGMIETTGTNSDIVNGAINNTFSDNSISGNSKDGVDLYSELIAWDVSSQIISSGITDSMSRNAVSANTDYGFYLESTVHNGAGAYDLLTNVSLQDNTLTNNGINGAYLKYDTDGTTVIDLGGGSLGSSGNNILSGNTGLDLVNETANGIKAENNWWGDNDPSDQAGGTFTIDYTPWLTSAP